MNPFLQNLFYKKAIKSFERKKVKTNRTKFIQDKAREYSVVLKHELTDYSYILMGVVCAAFGIESFLIPSEFIDGGVMGISLIVYNLTGLPLALLVVLFNIPFIIMAVRTVSYRFAIKSTIAISVLAILLYLIPFPEVTKDKSLVAVFGGLFLGAGIGFAIRGGAIIDGTEVLAIYLSRKMNATVGTIILVFNILIFAVSAYVLSIEVALYAILTYFIASRTIDFIIDGVEEYIAVTIISDKSNAIRLSIIRNMGHGCTLISGKKGLTREGDELKDTEIVYTIITRLEISKLKTEVELIDDKAFLIMTSVKDTKGGMVKKKPINKIK